MSTQPVISRVGFILIHADAAERDGVAYHTVPHHPVSRTNMCLSEDKQECAFFAEDCKGIPCQPSERRQWHGKGSVIWLRTGAPDE